MDIGGKRSINSLSGSAESVAPKRRRPNQPEGEGSPTVQEHFRWCDLPRDIFCHLASVLLLTEYRGLRLVSRSLQTLIDGTGPVATASHAKVDFEENWQQRTQMKASWCSGLRLKRAPEGIDLPRLADILGAAPGWSTLYLARKTIDDGFLRETALPLLRLLNERLPDGRGSPPRRLYLNLVKSAPMELIEVLASLKNSGKLCLTGLNVRHSVQNDPSLFQLGDLNELKLRGSPSEVLPALRDGGSVRRLVVHIDTEEDVDALTSYLEKRPVEWLRVIVGEIRRDALIKLLRLPLRKAKLELSVEDRAEQAVLEALKKCETLEDLCTFGIALDHDFALIQACKNMPALKWLYSGDLEFDRAPGGALFCKRARLDADRIAETFDTIKADLAKVENLTLVGSEWETAGLPGNFWSTVASARTLSMSMGKEWVFPWDCLSLTSLTELSIESMNAMIHFPRVPASQAACSLRELTLQGVKPELEGLLALLRLCPALERLELACLFDDTPVTAAARLLIAAFEIQKLKRFILPVQSKVLIEYVNRIGLQGVRPELELELWSYENPWHPDDAAQALALIDQYYASKMPTGQETLSQRFALPASSEMETERFDAELPEAPDWL